MSFFRYLMLLALFLGAAPSSYANFERQDGSQYDEDLNDSDFQAVRDFVKTKRDVSLRQKATSMSISGDVRFEWRNLHEKGQYIQEDGVIINRNLRGGNARDLDGLPVSCNDFDVEFNLYFDYVSERAWAVAQLNFDNSAGVIDNGKSCTCLEPGQALIDILTNGRCGPDPRGWHGSGTYKSLALKKAYFGYNVFKNDCSRMDIEIGRRRMYNVFDSKIQFCSQMDGILAKYSTTLKYADFYLNAAAFVVDERVNHFSGVAEIGFKKIADSNFDFKYSIIHWPKLSGINRCGIRNPLAMRSINSQFTVYYHLDQKFVNQPVTLYGAFLVNGMARKVADFPYLLGFDSNDEPVIGYASLGKENIGWYVGAKVGDKVDSEGDWSFEFMFQYLQARAVPDGDVNGIGRGNVLDYSFTQNLNGNANFMGPRFELLYAITDHMVLDTIIAFSREINRKYGGRHHYSYLKMEAVYAF